MNAVFTVGERLRVVRADEWQKHKGLCAGMMVKVLYADQPDGINDPAIYVQNAIDDKQTCWFCQSDLEVW